MKLPVSEATKKAVLEMLKEAFRIGLFAFASAVVEFLLDKLAGMDQGLAFVAAGTIILRLADKFIHTNQSIPFKGISPV